MLDDLPFDLSAMAIGSSTILVRAAVQGDEVTSERYLLGNGKRRNEIAEAWAADSRLWPDKRTPDVHAVRAALERLEADVWAAMEHANSEGEEDDGDAPKGNCLKQSEQLVCLALENFRIGRTADDEPFAVRKIGPNVAFMFRGSRDALRANLSRLYRQKYETTPSTNALSEALCCLHGEALAATPEPLFLRLAQVHEDIVIDLGDMTGRAIVITPDQWYVADRSPVVFRRTALTAPLPEPVRGGALSQLRALLNVTDVEWPLLLEWLLAAFFLNIPHPILMLGGEAGSGKSSLARLLICLFDPSIAPLRSQPTQPRQWVIGASGSWGVAVDNISTIPDWWSDCLCKAVTGDGWVDRSLFTNGDLFVIAFHRVVILTSIDAGALRNDLAGRCVLCELRPFGSFQRLTDEELTRRFTQLRPAILGGLLDLLIQVRSALPTVRVAEDTRLLDFARVLAAMDQVLGTNAVELFLGQRTHIVEEVIEGDSVAQAVIDLVRQAAGYEGTVGQLLKSLTTANPPPDWPRDARALSGRLRRAASSLRSLGIDVEFPPRTRRGAVVVIKQVVDPPSRPSPPSQSPPAAPEGHTSGDEE